MILPEKKEEMSAVTEPETPPKKKRASPLEKALKGRLKLVLKREDFEAKKEAISLIRERVIERLLALLTRAQRVAALDQAPRLLPTHLHQALRYERLMVRPGNEFRHHDASKIIATPFEFRGDDDDDDDNEDEELHELAQLGQTDAEKEDVPSGLTTTHDIVEATRNQQRDELFKAHQKRLKKHAKAYRQARRDFRAASKVRRH